MDKKLKEIGQAYLPGGVKAISKIERRYPNGVWSDVWDMQGVWYRNVENSQIVLWAKVNSNKLP